jgi:hypothetical protein
VQPWVNDSDGDGLGGENERWRPMRRAAAPLLPSSLVMVQQCRSFSVSLTAAKRRNFRRNGLVSWKDGFPLNIQKWSCNLDYVIDALWSKGFSKPLEPS